MSAEGWNHFKFEDICTKIGSGATPTGGANAYKNAGISLIRSQNVRDFSFSNEGLAFIDDEQAEKLKSVTVSSGDVLLNITGDSVARSCIVTDEVLPARVNQHVSIIRVNESLSNNKFVFYYTQHIKPYLLSLAGNGATRNALTKAMIEQLDILLPPLPEQRAIAATLAALDDKIELNNRINKTLEEIAQALFKRWFVDFEFPGENGQPYKSSGGEMEESELGLIPKGWKILALGEIIETVNGFSYKGSDIKESVNAMMTIKNFNRNGGFNAVGFKEIEISERVKDKHHVDLFDVVVACTDITQKADIIGNPVLVLTKGKYRKIVISMDLVKVIVKHPFISNCLIYMFLKDIRFKKQALGYTSGTTVLHLNKMVFSDYPIIIPEDEKLLEKMSFIIEPIFHLIGMTIDNSQNLTSLRDALLPKLMSGEIRVPIEEVAADV